MGSRRVYPGEGALGCDRAAETAGSAIDILGAAGHAEGPWVPQWGGTKDSLLDFRLGFLRGFLPTTFAPRSSPFVFCVVRPPWAHFGASGPFKKEPTAESQAHRCLNEVALMESSFRRCSAPIFPGSERDAPLPAMGLLRSGGACQEATCASPGCPGFPSLAYQKPTGDPDP